LENLGNTCFMNSALQCLLHIQPLVDYFMQGLMERDLNPTSPKKGMLASSFNHLIQEVIAKRTGSSVAPTNFQKAVS
jgi:ubiquitin carboxyl-terminal hydrolase 4/11/15